MSGLLLPVLVLGALVVMGTAAPARLAAGVEGPKCNSPVEPHNPMDCAALLQMADILLREYEGAMKAYEARLQTERVRLQEEQARFTQIGSNSRTCIEYETLYNPYRLVCTKWSENNSNGEGGLQTERVGLKEEQAKLSQIGGNSRTCIEYETLYNPRREVCTKWSENNSNG